MSELKCSCPRVSVVVAAFNAAMYIDRAIASVRAQSETSWEAIVADDHSTDQTCRIVQDIIAKDGRVKLLRSDVNGGPGAARNRAIEAACGEWVAILDADDAWNPTRLERLLSAASGENCVVVADNYSMYDESIGREIGALFVDPRPTTAITADRVLRSEHPLGKARFGLLKPIVKRRFLAERGICYSTEIRYAEDFHFLMRILLEGGRGVLVSEALYVYTLPSSLVTGTKSLGSRTIPNLRDRIWIADDLIAKHGETASPDTLRALRRYRRWMADIFNGQRARVLWQQGQRLRAVALAIAQPRASLSYALTSPSGKRLRARVERSVVGGRL